MSAIDAVKFAFGSPDWTTNLLIGSVFLIIPIVGPFALNGWLGEIHQRLVRRHPAPVPKLSFTDLSHYLERGIGPFVVQLVLGIPVFLVAYFVLAIAIVAGIAVGRQPGAGGAAVASIILFGTLFALAIGLFGAVVMNGATTRAELTEEVGESLSPTRALTYASTTWKTVLASSFGLAFLALGLGLAGMAMCFVGLYPAVVAIQIAAMHLRSQIYEQYLARGGEPFVLKAPRVLPSEAILQGHAHPQHPWPPQHGYGPQQGLGPQQGFGPQHGYGPQQPWGAPPPGWTPPGGPDRPR